MIVQRAADLMKTSHGFIYLLDERQELLVLRLGIGLHANAVGYSMRRGEGMSGRVWQYGAALVENDYPNSPLRSTDPRFQAVQASLNVPLKREGRVVGVLGVTYLDSGRSFGDRELEVVTRYGELAAIAIDNARLYEEFQTELRDRRAYQQKLEYLSFHDAMTDLYNRRKLEAVFEDQNKFSAGNMAVLVCDVDGLKLLNDTFGHQQGDCLLVAVAKILKKCLPEQGMLFRVGGDEFAMVLPGVKQEGVETVYRSIRRLTGEHNYAEPTLYISLSVGYEVGDSAKQSLRDLFRMADNNMYREKLHRSLSARSAMVQTVKQLLSERDFATEEHADRLQRYVILLAEKAGVSESRFADLRLLAQFHDIGKVGISDAILKKPGPLNAVEMEEMKRHSEIGHRIVQSSPELLPIADWVLKHQERWDGTGYPLGIAGEEIPLECRILSIVDAYDAMTSDRPYRQAMSHAKAVEELQRNAGSQFDPNLVALFLQLLCEWEEKA